MENNKDNTKETSIEDVVQATEVNSQPDLTNITDLPEKTNSEEQIKQIKELQEQLAKEKEAKLMALADMDNYRKRMEKERSEIISSANIAIFKALADVIDDFSRTIEDLEKPEVEDKIDAFKPILDKTKGILADYNVEEIIVKEGDKFDPKIMESIGGVTVSSPDEANIVKHIAQKGYKFRTKDLIVRHARVIIGKLS